MQIGEEETLIPHVQHRVICGGGAITWHTKKQAIVALYSLEAEYI